MWLWEGNGAGGGGGAERPHRTPGLLGEILKGLWVFPRLSPDSPRLTMWMLLKLDSALSP